MRICRRVMSQRGERVASGLRRDRDRVARNHVRSGFHRCFSACPVVLPEPCLGCGARRDDMPEPGRSGRLEGTRRAAASTLFELAISLALVATGVTTVMLVFPIGVKAQQTARLRVLAAVKAVEMAESFAATHNTNPAVDAEAFAPWDVPSSRCTMAPDIEQRLATSRFGIMPLPLAIARRIDSDGDAIARILDEGGLLYYAQPTATTNLEEQ